MVGKERGSLEFNASGAFAKGGVGQILCAFATHARQNPVLLRDQS